MHCNISEEKGKNILVSSLQKTLSGRAKDVMKGSIQRLQLLILGVSDGHCQYQIFWSGHWVGKKIVTPMVAECQSGDNIGQSDSRSVSGLGITNLDITELQNYRITIQIRKKNIFTNLQ